MHHGNEPESQGINSPERLQRGQTGIVELLRANGGEEGKVKSYPKFSDAWFMNSVLGIISVKGVYWILSAAALGFVIFLMRSCELHQ